MTVITGGERDGIGGIGVFAFYIIMNSFIIFFNIMIIVSDIIIRLLHSLLKVIRARDGKVIRIVEGGIRRLLELSGPMVEHVIMGAAGVDIRDVRVIKQQRLGRIMKFRISLFDFS